MAKGCTALTELGPELTASVTTALEDFTPSSGFCGQLYSCAASSLTIEVFKKQLCPGRRGTWKSSDTAFHVKLGKGAGREAKDQIHGHR